MSEKPRWWIITVDGGYGSYAVFDTPINAERMRGQKAYWKGAIARKRHADRRRTDDKALIALAQARL